MASRLYCYRTGCTHDECRRAWNSYAQNRKRQIAYGRWAPYVDAAPVREHVQWLISQGVPVNRLAPIYPTVSILLYGAPHRGLDPTRRMRRESAEALLAIRPSLDMLGPNARIDGVGARRRIQGLCALGWSMVAIARHMGSAQYQVRTLLREDTVTKSMYLRVVSVYEDLSMTRPEGPYAEKTRTWSERKGWVPPLAWDEEYLDLLEDELEVELERRVSLMDSAEIYRSYMATREGDRSPLIVAAGREHLRRRVEARRLAKKAAA